MSPVKIGLIGATGETGSSIVDGLLEAGNFEIIALTRPASMGKPANKRLQNRGVVIRECDLTSSQHQIVCALQGIEILISAIAPLEQPAQIPLATAAKISGVERFIPCAFVSIIPPGIHLLRDIKETVYNHIKTIRLPYTIIDVGWWYQITVPPLPSGKTTYAVTFKGDEVAGDGNVPSGLTDLRDIGRYVARIAIDERTLNKYVFVYNELWTQNQILEVFERLSGEEISRKHISAVELQRRIDSVPGGPEDVNALFVKVPAQYAMSWGIRGDNTPEYAKYLGYLDGKELYPDLEYVKYETYVKEVLDGRAKTVYDELKVKFAAHCSQQA